MILYKLTRCIVPTISKMKKVEDYIPSITHGRVIKVHDGDNITIAARVNNVSKLYKFNIRINDIDTPDIRSRNNIEKAIGIKVKYLLRTRILDEVVRVEIKGKDNYGRYIADVYHNSVNISEWLVNNKYGVRRNGSKQKFDKQKYKIVPKYKPNTDLYKAVKYKNK